MGRIGILQNPAKFQFCQKQEDLSWLRIGENTVTPMPHISGAVRDFPTPVNRTDLRSLMALAQQISYATDVAPKLIPFRELLKATTP